MASRAPDTRPSRSACSRRARSTSSKYAKSRSSKPPAASKASRRYAAAPPLGAARSRSCRDLAVGRPAKRGKAARVPVELEPVAVDDLPARPEQQAGDHSDASRSSGATIRATKPGSASTSLLTSTIADVRAGLDAPVHSRPEAEFSGSATSVASGKRRPGAPGFHPPRRCRRRSREPGALRGEAGEGNVRVGRGRSRSGRPRRRRGGSSLVQIPLAARTSRPDPCPTAPRRPQPRVPRPRNGRNGDYARRLVPELLELRPELGTRPLHEGAHA